MKLAFVDLPWAMSLPPVQSGSLALWTWQIATRLAGEHRVIVYQGCRTYERPRVAPCRNVEYRLPWVGLDERALRALDRLGMRRPLPRQAAARGYYYLSYALQVALDMRREGIDVVHIHQCSQFARIVRAFNPRAKIVLHMHSEWLTQFDPKLIAPRLPAHDMIFGCSDYITDLIRRRFPEAAARCHTVPNGVDTEKFTPGAGTGGRAVKRLAFVGRVSPEKGIHDLIEAFERVALRRQDVELEIVGPVCSLPPEWIVELSPDPLVANLKRFYAGDYETHLRARIGKASEGRVIFTGKIRYDELVERYRNIDILINPSLSESFGMTVVEAMACGKPAIVTRVGGMTETVQDGTNGLIVPPASPAALAGAIERLLDDGRLARRMGAAGRQVVEERYSWDRVAARWLERVTQQEARGVECCTAS